MYRYRNYDSAENYFLQTLEFNPFSGVANSCLADLYFRSGDIKKLDSFLDSLISKVGDYLPEALELFISVNRTKQWHRLEDLYPLISTIDSTIDIPLLRKINRAFIDNIPKEDLINELGQYVISDQILRIVYEIWSTFPE